MPNCCPVDAHNNEQNRFIFTKNVSSEVALKVKVQTKKQATCETHVRLVKTKKSAFHFALYLAEIRITTKIGTSVAKRSAEGTLQT